VASLYVAMFRGPAESNATAELPKQTAIESVALAKADMPPASPTPMLVIAGAVGPLAPMSPVAPTPTATSTASATVQCEPASNLLSCIYTIQPGDTLSELAAEFGIKASGPISPAQLLAESNKPDVIHSDEILPGQKLRVPLLGGVIHTVLSEESLSQVASDYGVSTESIAAVTQNGLTPASDLLVGQELLIPRPMRLPSDVAASAPTPTPGPTETPVSTASPAPVATKPGETPEPEDTPAVPTATPTTTATKSPTTPTLSPTPAPAQSGKPFIWPAKGPISSYFGPSHPLGIDIDFFADPNQPVKAAASGTVTFAGGDPCCSYGYYVTIQHANGLSTLYGHLSKINVVKGQQIGQGEVLGLGGRTGYATGNHLHFEVRKDGKAVDPLLYLP
jgi:murein DD-endopeptidase MepM/ murein hydrolase activator NlpD